MDNYYEIDGMLPDKETFIRIKLKAPNMVLALDKAHALFKKNAKLKTFGADKIHKNGTVIKGEGKQAFMNFPLTQKIY